MKVRKPVESMLEEAQSGFRNGSCIQDDIFTVKQITEKSTKEGFYELHRSRNSF